MLESYILKSYTLKLYMLELYMMKVRLSLMLTGYNTVSSLYI